MKVIGITGGIGSGKSTVSRILQDLGAAIVDADKIAREVVHKGEQALNELVEYFGENILDENGELDRRVLADEVFGDIEKLKILNSITHKYIVQRMIEQVEKLKIEQINEIIVVDAPIPVEHGFMDIVDEVWVVTADRETRIKRIMERNEFTLEQANDRLNSQIRDEEYIKLADEVLVNNGSMEEIENSVAKLFVKLKKLR